MFTVEERSLLRDKLLNRAFQDSRIAAGAVTGSAAAGTEDSWSDIDLAFGVANGVVIDEVITEWTQFMYERHSAIHHLDMKSGTWLYRVFLLPNTLQVDIAFVSAHEFRALSPKFRLHFGTAEEPAHALPQDADYLAGLGWLYALHARSSIARNRLWQAEYMVSGVRDNALALACVRHGLPSGVGRGYDQLPSEVSERHAGALVRSLEVAELSRAFEAALDGLLFEIDCSKRDLADKLRPSIESLAKFSSFAR